MQFHILVQALALATAISAAPAAQDGGSQGVTITGPASLTPPSFEASELQARASSLGWAVLWTGDGATGSSGAFMNNNKCQHPKKNDAHSSITMVNCKCHFYQDANCKGPKLALHSGKNMEGGVSLNWFSDNLKAGQTWDKRISSLICWSY